MSYCLTMISRFKTCTNISGNDVKFLMCRALSTKAKIIMNDKVTLLGQDYPVDQWTNLTKRIISKLGKNLHVTPYHPLCHIRQRIVDYFYMRFHSRIGNVTFSVYDNVSPIVTTAQNFDSLLVPKDHSSRDKQGCYYINQDTLLRAHTTAHQAELVSMGLNNFLIIGDVYRRDEIDKVHYPVFHQVDGVRICTKEEVFQNTPNSDELMLFENKGVENTEKQSFHTLESVKVMENELKDTLIGLAQTIFGQDIHYRWVKEYFPFTHPSWELEIYYNDQWLELLGCGIIRQEILQKAGAGDRIGWAFGLGLERLAMLLYDVPDIRLFWSNDTGFLNQFKFEDHNTAVKYKSISIYPQCMNDISFWLPEDGSYSSNKFYDIVWDIGGDKIEQILLKDVYTCPETKKLSHCYTIVYRHQERTLTKAEVNIVHNQIRQLASEKLHVTIR